MLPLLAESTDVPVIETVMPALSMVSSLGFAIWYAWHTATKTIPQQQQEHREAIREMAVSHAATIDKISVAHAATIKEMTEQHAESIKELVGELRSQRDAFDRWKQARD